MKLRVYFSSTVIPRVQSIIFKSNKTQPQPGGKEFAAEIKPKALFAEISSQINFLLWCFIVWQMFGVHIQAHAQQVDKKQKVMVVLGDSLTEGYGVSRESAFPALLEKKLSGWKVINSGISGATTASAKGRISWVLKSNPQIVILILGANDGLRGLKVSESQKNLDEAIEILKQKNCKIVLGGITMPPNYGKEYVQDFKKMYSSLAKKHSLPLIPFILKDVAGNSKLNLADGIHPNEEGHKVIAENVFQFIKDIL